MYLLSIFLYLLAIGISFAASHPQHLLEHLVYDLEPEPVTPASPAELTPTAFTATYTGRVYQPVDVPWPTQTVFGEAVKDERGFDLLHY